MRLFTFAVVCKVERGHIGSTDGAGQVPVQIHGGSGFSDLDVLQLQLC